MTVGPAVHPWKSNRILLVILLVALALRVGWAVTRPVSRAAIEILPDQQEYLSLGGSLLHGRYEFLDRRFDDTVRAFRMPGYPAFLALFGANVRAARVGQALLDTGTVLAIYLLAGPLTRGRSGSAPLLAAALVACNPFLIYFTGLVLSETLFTAMLVWGMFLLVKGNGGRGGSRVSTLVWLGGAVVLGISVLVRPSAVGLPLALGVCSVFLNRGRPRTYQSSRQRPGPAEARGAWPLPVLATMLFIVLLILLPWAIRNRLVLGQWVWLDTNSGFTLYDGYNPDATGASDQTFVNREPELQSLGEVDRSIYLTKKAIRYARSHVSNDLYLAVVKLVRTWSPAPLSAVFGKPGYQVIAVLYEAPFQILLILGLLRGKLPRSAKVFLIAPAIYLSTVHALTVGSLRYRIPVEPALAIVAVSWAGVRTGALRAAREEIVSA